MLTIEQTENIVTMVEKEQIHLSHLAFELIDHICCEVESEMKKGTGFTEALKRVETRIGYRGLKKVQEDTLYLIDKNYRIMKNVMKTTGIIGPALIGLGSLFKIMHWPGAGILLVLGFLVLCFIFLPSSANVLYKESREKYGRMVFIAGFIAAFLFSVGILWKIQHWPGAGIMLLVGDSIGILLFLPVLLIGRIRRAEDRKKTATYILGLVALIIYLSGSLFKLMHWPGAAMALLLGAILLFGIALPLYTFKTFRDKSYVEGKFIFIVVASVWVIIHTALISIKVSGNVFGTYGTVYKDLITMNVGLKQDNTQVFSSMDSITASGLSAVRERSTALVAALDEIRSDLIRMADYDESAIGDVAPFSDIRNLEDKSIAYNYMVGKDQKGKALKLKADLNAYLESVKPMLDSVYGNSLPMTDLENDLSEDNWSRLRFGQTLGFTFDYLSLLEFRVLMLESEVYVSKIQNRKIN
ncbi:MAG: GldL-related protein [Bacteroidota bacterium]